MKTHSFAISRNSHANSRKSLILGTAKALMLGTATALTALAVAWAQVTPGLINFQGRLTDSSNNPLSGSHDYLLLRRRDRGIRSGPSQSGISVFNGFAVN